MVPGNLCGVLASAIVSPPVLMVDVNHAQVKCLRRSRKLTVLLPSFLSLLCSCSSELVDGFSLAGSCACVEIWICRPVGVGLSVIETGV
jgi:hypothetical protein